MGRGCATLHSLAKTLRHLRWLGGVNDSFFGQRSETQRAMSKQLNNNSIQQTRPDECCRGTLPEVSCKNQILLTGLQMEARLQQHLL